MQIVWWLTGVLVTISAIRFVFLVFKKLMTKDNMNDLIDRANEGIHNAANKVVNGIEKKCYESRKKRARKKREEMKKNRPIVTIH